MCQDHGPPPIDLWLVQNLTPGSVCISATHRWRAAAVIVHGCAFKRSAALIRTKEFSRMKLLSRKSIAMCALAAAAIAAPVAARAVTYTVQVEAAGSSAQFYVFAEAAYQQAKAFSGGTAKHYTAKGAGFVHDNRAAGVTDEIGNLWVVWSQNSAGTAVEIWTYLSVDSIVGVRAFESAPRASLTFPGTLPAPGNIVTTWDDNSADVALDTNVEAKLSGGKFTAAFTDIRPEDALYASNHLLTGVGTCAGTP